MSADPTQIRPHAPAAALAAHDALPAGTRFGEFEVVRVLGVGGFGIVYLAHDHSLERMVALKEYMPASLASRGVGPMITVRSGSFADTYAVGLRSFVNEARLLARFDHPSLVKVYRFWEDNATAYMVMPFLQGNTLREARRELGHAPDEAWIRDVLDPILEALDLLHRQGVYHRDIAPDNIMLPSDGPPILLDFGAARRVIGDRTQSLTAILKPSYAPIEQYAEMTTLRQGPWTDLYALGAVLHFLLFGKPPEPATARAVCSDIQVIAHRRVPGVSQRLIETVAWMLGVRPAERPQDVAMVRAALDGLIEIPSSVSHPPAREAADATAGAAISLASATAATAPDVSSFDPSVPLTSQPAFALTLLAPIADLEATRIGPSAVPVRVTTAANLPNPAATHELAPPIEPETQAVPATTQVQEPLQEPELESRPEPEPASIVVPAHSAKSPLFLGGLALALLIAGVVLWQFIALLGTPRPPAVDAVPMAATGAPGAASATPAAAVAQPVPPTPVASTAAQVPASVDSAAAVQAPSSIPVANGAMAGDDRKSGVAGAVPGTPASAAVRPGRLPRNRPDGALVPRMAEAAPLDPAERATVRQAEDVPATRPPAMPATGPATAHDACSLHRWFAFDVCMERECEAAKFRGNPECTRVLQMKHAREQRNQQG